MESLDKQKQDAVASIRALTKESRKRVAAMKAAGEQMNRIRCDLKTRAKKYNYEEIKMHILATNTATDACTECSRMLTDALQNLSKIDSQIDAVNAAKKLYLE